MHLKLDELICAIKSARNELVDLEDLSDQELKKIGEQFRRMRNGPRITESMRVTSSLTKAPERAR